MNEPALKKKKKGGGGGKGVQRKHPLPPKRNKASQITIILKQLSYNNKQYTKILNMIKSFAK